MTGASPIRLMMLSGPKQRGQTSHRLKRDARFQARGNNDNTRDDGLGPIADETFEPRAGNLCDQCRRGNWKKNRGDYRQTRQPSGLRHRPPFGPKRI